MNNEARDSVDSHANRDPITGEPGAHPVGTGVGAAAAGAAGAAIGATAGPIGAVVGAAIGSVVGGLVGKSAAEAVNPTVEADYWRDAYMTRPYAHPDRAYEDYEAAYRTGYEGYARYHQAGRSYEDVEPDLQREYETGRNGSGLGWEDARHATRDAWQRSEFNQLAAREEAYWKDHYTNQPYYEPGTRYEDYLPAYRVGYENYLRCMGTGRSYEDVEPELEQQYNMRREDSRLSWNQARAAVRDAWMRAEQNFQPR